MSVTEGVDRQAVTTLSVIQGQLGRDVTARVFAIEESAQCKWDLPGYVYNKSTYEKLLMLISYFT